MKQAAQIIGIGLDTPELIGAGVGIGVVFAALIFRVARSPFLREQSFSYTILLFAFAAGIGLFAIMITFFVSGIEFSSCLCNLDQYLPSIFVLLHEVETQVWGWEEIIVTTEVEVVIETISPK